MHDPQVFLLDYCPPEVCRRRVQGRAAVGRGRAGCLAGGRAFAGGRAGCLAGGSDAQPPISAMCRLSHQAAAICHSSATACYEAASAAASLPGTSPYLHPPRPLQLRMEVSKGFVTGFANCMRTAAYLLRQGQLPKPRMVAQCAGVVPGLDKR